MNEYRRISIKELEFIQFFQHNPRCDRELNHESEKTVICTIDNLKPEPI